MTEVEVAIAHDYLTQRGGAERVVLALARAFPSAPIYTTLYNPGSTYPEFGQHLVRTSWLNHVPLLRRFHRLALPMLAWASNSVQVPAKHTIVSSSGWAHGFRTTGSKIVYCYSPARWLYQQDAYLGTDKLTLKRLALQIMAPLLKRWDKKKAATATKYFAISTAVQQRILDAYGIESEVLPAPHSIDPTLTQQSVDLSSLPCLEDGFYLCISRLLPYKNVDVVIQAFNSLKIPLVIVGAGPEERRLRVLSGPSVLMTKHIDDSQIRWLYANCRAVVSASYEDFGLTPIEAAAYGKPSVVLRWGGFLDTVREGVTGLFFDRPVPDLVADAVVKCQTKSWNPSEIERHANLFTEERFVARIAAELTQS